MEFRFERERSNKFAKEKMIEELKRVAKIYNFRRFSVEEFNKVSVACKKGVIIKSFGSWNKALDSIGIPLKERTKRHYSEVELFNEMERVWKVVGHRPSELEWNRSQPKINYNLYRRYFDGWTNACLKFIEFKMGNSVQVESEESNEKKPNEDCQTATPETILIGLTITSLVLIDSFGVGAAQSGLIAFLNSDTVWTKANSPYTLSGPVVVSTGVTLTINSGATININGYYLYVNGTLKATGTATDNVLIYGGEITFGGSSSTNSAFENTIINSTVSSGKSLTLNNNTINSVLSAGDGSTVTNNKITATLSLGNSCILTSNTISGDVSTGNGNTILNNAIFSDISAGTDTTISNNVINGTKLVPSGMGGHSYATAVKVGNYSVVSDNSISGGVSAAYSTIRNNNISGGGPFTDWVGRPEDSTSALEVSGNSSVTSNVLWSTTGGYGLLIRHGYTVVSNNIIKNSLRVAGDALIENNLVTKGGIQVGDIYISAFNEINYGYGNAVIRNNIITDNGIGIWSSYTGGSATIQQNLIANSTTGISLKSQVTAIQNNTIVNSNTAIMLNSGSPSD